MNHFGEYQESFDAGKKEAMADIQGGILGDRLRRTIESNKILARQIEGQAAEILELKRRNRKHILRHRRTILLEGRRVQNLMDKAKNLSECRQNDFVYQQRTFRLTEEQDLQIQALSETIENQVRASQRQELRIKLHVATIDNLRVEAGQDANIIASLESKVNTLDGFNQRQFGIIKELRSRGTSFTSKGCFASLKEQLKNERGCNRRQMDIIQEHRKDINILKGKIQSLHGRNVTQAASIRGYVAAADVLRGQHANQYNLIKELQGKETIMAYIGIQNTLDAVRLELKTAEDRASRREETIRAQATRHGLKIARLKKLAMEQADFFGQQILDGKAELCKEEILVTNLRAQCDRFQANSEEYKEELQQQEDHLMELEGRLRRINAAIVTSIGSLPPSHELRRKVVETIADENNLPLLTLKGQLVNHQLVLDNPRHIVHLGSKGQFVYVQLFEREVPNAKKS